MILLESIYCNKRISNRYNKEKKIDKKHHQQRFFGRFYHEMRQDKPLAIYKYISYITLRRIGKRKRRIKILPELFSSYNSLRQYKTLAI